jgi:magnesium and cobalt transporter
VTEIADFNERFGTSFPDEDFDTVGGLVVARFGRLPKRGETILIDGFTFQVLRADSRKVHSLLVERPETKPAGALGARAGQ